MSSGGGGVLAAPCVSPRVDSCFRPAFQVRNLCYMVTRREKMKHTLCDLQEKIFHLQIQLLEEDIAGGEEANGSP